MGDKEALERALEIINSHRRKVREKLRALDDTARSLEEALGLADESSTTQFDGRVAIVKKESDRFKNMSATQAAKLILEEHGSPMPMSEIVVELIRGGYGTTDSKRKMYMRTYNTIKSNSAFIKLPGKKAIIGLAKRDRGRLDLDE